MEHSFELTSISPAAAKGTSWIGEYTAYNWVVHGLSHPAFGTVKSRLFYAAARPLVSLIELFGNVSLTSFLLQRHLMIDALLHREIHDRGPTVVLEIGAGYSGRGYRFLNRYSPGALRYIEADLPSVINGKKKMLSRLPAASRPELAVCDINCVGPFSLEALLSNPSTEKSHLILITEGVIDYMALEGVADFWSRLATVCRKFATATYLTDLTPRGSPDASKLSLSLFTTILGKLVREPLTRPFSSDRQAELVLRESGFDLAEVIDPSLGLVDLPPQAKVGLCVGRIARAQTWT